jgi:hypothetical protein
VLPLFAAYVYISRLSEIDSLRLILRMLLSVPYISLVGGMACFYDSGAEQLPLLLLPAIFLTGIGVIGIAITFKMFFSRY